MYKYYLKVKKYLNFLCSIKPNRRTGSKGNQSATTFFKETVKSWGYEIDVTQFSCLDFENSKVFLSNKGGLYQVYISPYSLGCDIVEEIIPVSSVEELENCFCANKILLMKRKICKEQLMPKNIVFYNPPHHRYVYQLLEKKNPRAIITATSKNPELVGAIYPFPMIEDGDFNIPSVCCTDFVGEEIDKTLPQRFHLVIKSRRICSFASNVVIRKNVNCKNKIIICAHIDAYGDSPGALDDASGTIVLLILAEMLKETDILIGIELIAFNGEDNYSAGGEMDYIKRYGDKLDKVLMAINIDDVGYIYGKDSFSFYQCSDNIYKIAKDVFAQNKDIIQGDHMVFTQQNIPAIAFTSTKMKELLMSITHTSNDVPMLVDVSKLVGLAYMIKEFILKIQELNQII